MDIKNIIKNYKNKDNPNTMMWDVILSMIQKEIDEQIKNNEGKISDDLNAFVKELTTEIKDWSSQIKQDTEEKIKTHINTRKVEIKGDKGESIKGERGEKGEQGRSIKGDKGDLSDVDYEKAIRGVLAKLGDIREKGNEIVAKINDSTDKILISSVKNLQEELDNLRKSITTSKGYMHGGGLTTVSHDATLTGTGKASDPLKVSPRRVISTTDDATSIIDVTLTDDYVLTAVANTTEFSLTGTPTSGQMILIYFKDAGVSKGLTWTGISELGVTLPVATVPNKRHLVGIKYFASSSTWFAIAVSVEV